MKLTHAQKKENNICHHQTYPKRKAEGSSLHRLEMKREESLEHQKRRAQ